MSSPKQVSGSGFVSSPAERLTQYVGRLHYLKPRVRVPVVADAWTRNFFRMRWKKSTAIAAVYPEPFDPDVHPYLDITRLFVETGIPVPAVYAVDGELGIIVQEDLGDRQLAQFFESASEEECEEYRERAINLIARVQRATEKAIELQSISSRLAFDEPKLSWELRFFYDHYFGSLRGETLKRADEAELKAELNDIAAELAAVPRVLCHRDFHSANLMVDPKKHLR